MSDVFLKELGLPRPDAVLNVGAGSHAEQTARTMLGIEELISSHRPRLLVVAGDVNSTLGGALAGAKAGVPVAHIESGLRSFDPSMPEEVNRKLTDHVSALLLAHSQDAVDNLAREGIAGNHVLLVGNTMISSLLHHLEAARTAAPWKRLGVEPGSFALVTLHRPELVDHPRLLASTVDALLELAGEIQVVFPVHPRTRRRLAESHLEAKLGASGLRLLGPCGYLEFLGLEAAARFVITDSGGIQEETSALGVPCFTLRRTTERPVTVELGSNTLLGLQPDRITEVPALVRDSPPARPIPLWDAEAGARAAGAIAAFVEGEVPLAVA
jgi:UDP-N-acetylglucosamine 2-epimerase (non-hydrolysing)